MSGPGSPGPGRATNGPARADFGGLYPTMSGMRPRSLSLLVSALALLTACSSGGTKSGSGSYGLFAGDKPSSTASGEAADPATADDGAVDAGVPGGGPPPAGAKPAPGRPRSSSKAPVKVSTGGRPRTVGGSAAPGGAPGGTDAAPSGDDPGAPADPGDGPSDPAGPVAKNPTAPGRYSYVTTGTQTSSQNPDPQPINANYTFTVDPARGTDQRYVKTGQGTEVEQVLRLVDDGSYLVYLRQENEGFLKEYRPQPPVLSVPDPAPVGKSWGWKIVTTDKKTTIEASFQVARTEDVTVNGETVPTVVIKATISTKGDVVSTIKRTTWVSDQRRLVVREDDVTDGSFSDPDVNLTFHTETSQRLQSINPA